MYRHNITLKKIRTSLRLLAPDTRFSCAYNVFNSKPDQN